jgi:hypothetical protein
MSAVSNVYVDPDDNLVKGLLYSLMEGLSLKRK